MEATRCRPLLPGGRRLWEEGSKSDLEVKVVGGRKQIRFGGEGC